MIVMEKTVTPKTQAPAVRPEVEVALMAVIERHRELSRRLKEK